MKRKYLQAEYPQSFSSSVVRWLWCYSQCVRLKAKRRLKPGPSFSLSIEIASGSSALPLSPRVRWPPGVLLCPCPWAWCNYRCSLGGLGCCCLFQMILKVSISWGGRRKWSEPLLSCASYMERAPVAEGVRPCQDERYVQHRRLANQWGCYLDE